MVECLFMTDWSSRGRSAILKHTAALSQPLGSSVLIFPRSRVGCLVHTSSRQAALTPSAARGRGKAGWGVSNSLQIARVRVGVINRLRGHDDSSCLPAHRSRPTVVYDRPVDSG